MSTKKILLLGGSGQLGMDLQENCPSNFEIVAPPHSEVDITKPITVQIAINSYQPNIIINTVAYHQLDECEKNPEKAFQINSLAVRDLAIECQLNNICLVHISTDYVFDGNTVQPYNESDLPNPLSVYGNSKLAGEHFIQAICEGQNYFIIRTSGLYGKHMCRGKNKPNFVNLMLKLASEGKEINIVNNERLTPTYTKDLAEQIFLLLSSCLYAYPPSGIYHATCEKDCTWYEFAKTIFYLLDKKVVVNPTITKSRLRPSYSVLNNNRLKMFSLNIMPNWVDSLAEYLKNIE